MSDGKFKNIGREETLVIEECAELIQILMKVDRFGWFSYNPYDPKKVPNVDLVLAEIDDVTNACYRLETLILKIKENVL